MSTALRRIEVIIATVLLAVVATRVSPSLSDAEQEQSDGVLKARLASINARIDRYRHDHRGRAPDFDVNGWGTHVDPGSLVGGRYLDTAPINPAFPGFDKASIIVVEDASIRGSDRAAWVWNAPRGELFASGFDEAAGRSTGRPAD